MVVLTLLRNYFHDKNYSKLELGVHKRNNEDFVYLSLTQSDWGKDSFVRKNKFNMLLYLLNKHMKSFECFLEQCYSNILFVELDIHYSEFRVRISSIPAKN